MDRFQPGDTGEALFAHPHAAVEHDARVYAAHGRELKEALVRDAVDHEADLVHVGRYHKARCLDAIVGICVFYHYQVAHAVRLYVVRVPERLSFYVFAHFLLGAGDAVKKAELFKSPQHSRASFPGSSAYAARSCAQYSTSAKSRHSAGECM